jgi:hypothetical protein
MAVERLKSCDNVLALAEELGCIGGCCITGGIGWNRSTTAKRRRKTAKSVNSDGKSHS